MALLQCLLKFNKENPDSILYEVKSDVRSLRATLNIITKLHPSQHVILYTQDIFVFGDSLSEDLLSINPGRITLVSSARTGEWREHIERRIGSLTVSFKYQRFCEFDYGPLIERLVAYVPAPGFIKSSDEARLRKFKNSRSQLLIAMKEATSSRQFTDVITNEFNSLPNDDCRKLALIAGIATLARSGVHESTAKAAYEQLETQRKFKDALITLDGIVSSDENRRLWARHELYIRHIIENVADIEEIIAVMVALLKTFTKYKIPVVKNVGRLDSILFKFLLNHDFNAKLTRRRNRPQDGRRIYEAFEVQFQLDGHFWLQYGQYLGTIGDEEQALVALSKSTEAYSDNSFAIHSYADMQLRVAIKRSVYDHKTVELLAEASKTLLEQHQINSNKSDQYPIVVLAEKHVGALLRHGQDESARNFAKLYFKELENLAHAGAAAPLLGARARLMRYLTLGVWS